MSLEKTEEIRDQSIGTLSNKSIIKIDLSFEDKSQLKEIIDNLSGVAGSILVFTDNSNYCGAARIADLSKFNTQFNFEEEHSGIISILSQDLTNNLVIDFYEEIGQQFMELEVQGGEWVKALPNSLN